MKAIWNYLFDEEPYNPTTYDPNIIRGDVTINDLSSFDMRSNELGANELKQKVNKYANWVLMGLIAIAATDLARTLGIGARTSFTYYPLPVTAALTSIVSITIIVGVHMYNRHIDSKCRKNI